MKKTRIYTGIDFTNIKPEQVQRLVKDLYRTGENDKRDGVFGQAEDRRQAERRQKAQKVMLDTRDTQSRRQSAGRRQRDNNPDNQHRVGIDYFV